MAEFYTNVTKYGKNILYRGYDSSGKRIITKIPFKPTLFVKAKKKTEWSSLYGDQIEPMKFDDMKEAKEFMEQYEDVHGFDIFGMEKFEYQYIIENFVDDVEYSLSSMRILSLDIETEISDDGGFPDIENANVAINLISLKQKGDKEVVAFAAQNWDSTAVDDVDLFSCTVDYRCFKDEATMLRAFVDYWASNYPDIITGWNTDTFDIPYIINRVNRILGDDYMKKMSPWGMVREKKIESRGDTIQVFELVGITQLDYLSLYRKFSFHPQESYALGFVATDELGVTKLEYEGSFKEFYTKNWNRFVSYNIRDTQLVDMMDDKFKFIELVMQIAYMAKCNFQDVFSPVRTWDVFIYSYLHQQKIAIPQRKKNTVTSAIEGAWVKDPVLGKMHNWIVSFDFASLYPSIIRQWNIGPETISSERFDVLVKDVVENTEKFQTAIQYAKENNLTLAANGTMYRRDKKGVFAQLMEHCLIGRKVAKKEMLKLEQDYQNTHDESLQPKIAALDGKQMALKILANSGYGAMLQPGFRYFYPPLGEAITLTGQASDIHLANTFNEYFSKLLKEEKDYVVYGDTDSIYLDLSSFVEKINPGKTTDENVEFLIKCDPQFQKIINKSVDEIYDRCHCFDKVMSSKREAIASKGFWTAKKRYALKVHNSEGVAYDPPKIKVLGLDLIKTSTPAAVRSMLKNSLPVMFDKGEIAVQEYIAKCRNDFMAMNPENVSFPRGVSDVTKWLDPKTIYKKGTPIHSRAAILYNEYTKSHRGKYQSIANGDKIKFIYLKLPNPIKEDVIGFPSSGHLPKELNVHNYIDWDLQFEKVFIAPMKGMLDALNWEIEKQNSLEDFFG